jgi:hypothetical protein
MTSMGFAPLVAVNKNFTKSSFASTTNVRQKLPLTKKRQHEKAIARDLGRTFPHHQFFTDGQSIGQENLFNVLKAYSLYDPQVGYCQGLSFIVAVLLLNMPDEQAFCLLVRLMHTYDLRGHFLPEMPKLQLRLFQFDRLIEELLPVLHIHFLRQGVKSSMFCSQWFLTLFSYRFPLDIVFRIYDNCLASGIEAIFAFSIVLLQKNEEKLLTLKFDEILNFLKTRVFERYKIESSGQNKEGGEGDRPAQHNVDEFVQDAVSLRITPFMLDAYAHEYADLIRARDAHAIEMDALRNSNRALAARVKELDVSLSQLNAEHVEVLNQLVMARLRNEEMEEELVRYKLLFVLSPTAIQVPTLIRFCLLAMQKRCIKTRTPCRLIGSLNYKWTAEVADTHDLGSMDVMLPLYIVINYPHNTYHWSQYQSRCPSNYK